MMKSFFCSSIHPLTQFWSTKSAQALSIVILLFLILPPTGFTQTVTGRTVTEVEYSGSEKGAFKQLTATSWAEYKVNSNQIHDTFTEQRRDNNSVYLLKSDGATIRIDVQQRKIYYNTHFLFNITEATAVPLDEGQGQTIIFELDNPAYNFKVFRTTTSDREAQFVGNLVSSAPLRLSATVGDVFTFEATSGNAQIAPYRVTQLGITARLTANSAADDRGLTPLIQTANLHSFDIFSIDPLYIDYNGYTNIPETNQKGGMRGQIFQEFKHTDLDYKTVQNSNGQYITPAGFTGIFRREDWSSGSTEVVSGSANYQQSIAADIAVSIGMDKIGKATNSGSFSHNTSTTLGYEHVYAFSKRKAKMYEVSVDARQAQLTTEFVEAVRRLPVSAAAPRSLATARADRNFQAYQNFIQQWGSHYPQQVEYGGILVNSMEFTERRYSELVERGIAVRQKVEATIKGVTLGRDAGGSIEQSIEQQYITGFTKFETFFKGGSGSPQNWEISEGTVQPIGISLARISELLSPEIFRLQLPHAELDKRKRMLEYALEHYIGSRTDNGSSLRPKRYRMSNVSMRVLTSGEGGGAELYGLIDMKAGSTLPMPGINGEERFIIASPIASRTIWDTRTIAVPELEDWDLFHQFVGAIEFTVDPKSGNFNHLKDLSVLLTAHVREEDDGRDDWDDIYNDDCIGVMACAKLSLDQVGTEPQPLKIHLVNRNWGADDGGWNIEIRAMVSEVDGTLR